MSQPKPVNIIYDTNKHNEVSITLKNPQPIEPNANANAKRKFVAIVESVLDGVIQMGDKIIGNIAKFTIKDDDIVETDPGSMKNDMKAIFDKITTFDGFDEVSLEGLKGNIKELKETYFNESFVDLLVNNFCLFNDTKWEDIQSSIRTKLAERKLETAYDAQILPNITDENKMIFYKLLNFLKFVIVVESTLNNIREDKIIAFFYDNKYVDNKYVDNKYVLDKLKKYFLCDQNNEDATVNKLFEIISANGKIFSKLLN